MKVLIVDDSPNNLTLLRAVLESENFQVVEASDGVEALAALDRENVDVVISDILMPGMDGYRLCYEVRKNQRLQALPFVFYTATYTAPSDEKLCYDLGGDKYLQKPASAAEILRTLQGAVTDARRCPSIRVASNSEADVMKEYSERLVSKLETRNIALSRAKEHLEQMNRELIGRTEELERVRAELQEMNRDLNNRVRRRTKELEAANMELEAFSYSVSHDLRAPLRHIESYTKLVLQNGADQFSESNLRHLHLIGNAVERMGGIIEALLELTRVTRSDIHRFPVDLSLLARETFVELQGGASGRVAQLDVAPGLIANGDQRLLRVALINLLGNALKFTSKRADARIEVGRLNGGSDAPYFVRDNGVGFDMAYADKLFGAFQRLHSQTDFQGTGIGLATVQRIIHRHNGKTWAEGIEGRGATFYFTLGGNGGSDGEQILASRTEAR